MAQAEKYFRQALARRDDYAEAANNLALVSSPAARLTRHCPARSISPEGSAGIHAVAVATSEIALSSAILIRTRESLVQHVGQAFRPACARRFAGLKPCPT